MTELQYMRSGYVGYKRRIKYSFWFYACFYGSPWLWGARLPPAYLRKWNSALASSEIRNEYKGVSMIDFNWGGQSKNEVFFQIALDALRMVETYSPRRFCRIQQEINFITNEVTIGFGDYDRIGKICSIDFGPYRVDPSLPEYEWHTAQFAALLVHQATIGSLFSRLVPYTKKSRKRIGYICYQEQKRFASRLPTTQFNFPCDLVPPFDERPFDNPVSMNVWQRLSIYFNKTSANFRNREKH